MNTAATAVESGDYAGLFATFDYQTGKLIPVPEYYIPQELLDWGQAPCCLEQLVSEEIPGIRHTVAVLPATGCAVDNLDTQKSVETIDEIDLKSDDSNVWSICQAFSSGRFERVRVEACFGRSEEEDEKPYRSRVSVDLQLSDHDNVQIVNPVRVSIERQISEAPSGGTFANGGLDARSVSEYLGPVLGSRQMQEFAAQEMANLCWEATAESSNGVGTQILFPGNFTVCYRSKENEGLELEMGWIDAEKGTRAVARRMIGKDLLSSGEMFYQEEGRLLEHS